MTWCGTWGAALGGYWWILPMFGLVVMGIMFFVCFRGFGCGCMGGRRRSAGELSDVRREIESLKEDVRKVIHQPS